MTEQNKLSNHLQLDRFGRVLTLHELGISIVVLNENMSFKPTKQQQNEALAGVFELYHNPINENCYDHYIYSFLNDLMLYPDSIKQALELTNKLNNQLLQPLTEPEKELAYQLIEARWAD